MNNIEYERVKQILIEQHRIIRIFGDVWHNRRCKTSDRLAFIQARNNRLQSLLYQMYNGGMESHHCFLNAMIDTIKEGYKYQFINVTLCIPTQSECDSDKIETLTSEKQLFMQSFAQLGEFIKKENSTRFSI